MHLHKRYHTRDQCNRCWKQKWMSCECWVWIAVRHLSLSPIISWISFVTCLVGCGWLSHSSSCVNEHRPHVSVCWVTMYSQPVYLIFGLYVCLDSKGDLWCFQWQCLITMGVISAALCICRRLNFIAFFHSITDAWTGAPCVCSLCGSQRAQN